MNKLALLLTGVLLAGPAVVLISPALIANPAMLQAASCAASSLVVVAEVPDELTATTTSGETVTLNKTQLTHARTIIQIGADIDGVGRDGILIALMAGLTESRLRMLANSTYPESASYPNDGVGADHDSLGIFQMRPQSGWGSVAELMSSTYQAQAFFGGPNGPNYPSPRGLLDIPGWQQLTRGQAAQAVEVSAFPDRYANYEPVAETILTALTVPRTSGGGSVPAAGDIAPTTRIVVPMPEGSYIKTSPFGMREDPEEAGPVPDALRHRLRRPRRHSHPRRRRRGGVVGRIPGRVEQHPRHRTQHRRRQGRHHVHAHVGPRLPRHHR